MTEAEFNQENIFEVNKATITQLKEKAEASSSGRYRLCLHHTRENLVNEMIIIVNKGSYIRPHRHPLGRDESYTVLEGKMIVFFFDDSGQVIRHFKMSDYNSGATSIYRLSASIWHLPVPLSDTVVYHEIFTGPFSKNRDVEYPSWAPPEDEHSRAKEYMEQLLTQYL